MSLALYAEISRGLMDGWNARVTASPAVGRAFNDAYMGR